MTVVCRRRKRSLCAVQRKPEGTLQRTPAMSSPTQPAKRARIEPPQPGPAAGIFPPAAHVRPVNDSPPPCAPFLCQGGTSGSGQRASALCGKGVCGGGDGMMGLPACPQLTGPGIGPTCHAWRRAPLRLLWALPGSSRASHRRRCSHPKRRLPCQGRQAAPPFPWCTSSGTVSWRCLCHLPGLSCA